MYDYIIVGQGVAGTLLSYFLSKQGKSFVIADEFRESSPSLVAAGLFNPITGRRIVKTWMADTIFPFAEETYKELESVLQTSFYYKKDIFKIFTSIKEQNDWLSKSSGIEFKVYVNDTVGYRLKNDCIPEPFGGFFITNSGYVNLNILIAKYRDLLRQNNQIIETALHTEDLVIEDNQVAWKNIKAKKIIFCDGPKSAVNKFFSYLPFVLTKGEVLTIKCPELNLDTILSKGLFLLPLGDDMYKVGSTYTWNETDESPTEAGKNDLLEKLKKVICCPFEIINHQAGIRPTVKDRRPLIGLHPQFSTIGIFNGMGTKGASLVPYFASHFSEFLVKGNPLNLEVDIVRFNDLLS